MFAAGCISEGNHILFIIRTGQWAIKSMQSWRWSVYSVDLENLLKTKTLCSFTCKFPDSFSWLVTALEGELTDEYVTGKIMDDEYQWRVEAGECNSNNSDSALKPSVASPRCIYKATKKGLKRIEPFFFCEKPRHLKANFVVLLKRHYANTSQMYILWI